MILDVKRDIFNNKKTIYSVSLTSRQLKWLRSSASTSWAERARTRTAAAWPDLAKTFCQFCLNFEVFGKFSRVYLVLSKILSLLWQNFNSIWQIFISLNGRKIKKESSHLVTLRSGHVMRKRPRARKDFSFMRPPFRQRATTASPLVNLALSSFMQIIQKKMPEYAAKMNVKWV